MKATRTYVRKPIGERLWPRVEKTAEGCWEYQGKRSQNNYGRISLGGRADGEGAAHRVAWELTNGPIPEGLVVCHKCDNPPCINPDHLFIGTHAENQADAIAKGRKPSGERHHNAVLTAEKAQQIRDLLASGMHQAAVARAMGVSAGTVANVQPGRRWAA